jgi:SAM-dependent methyltransferase
VNADRTRELESRMSDAELASRELRTIQEGRRRGLYRVLADSGPVTADDFAPLAGVAPDFAAEWLEQQAAAGLLDVTRAGSEQTREYLLPGEHLPVLLAPESPFGRADVIQELRSWLGAMPDIAATLAEGGSVLDAGCGEGWSTLALARAFPEARVVGAEADERAVLRARARAAGAALEQRLTFLEVELDDAPTLRSRLPGGCALVAAFDSLHAARDPLGALVAFRGLLARGGAVLVTLARLPDEFTAPADRVGRLAYADRRVVRAPRLRAWATEAGFGVSELPVEHGHRRFFRLDPEA